MVDCVLDGGDPKITGADGLRVVAMSEAMEHSIESRSPVMIDSVL